MEMNARCIACLIKKQDEKIRKESDEKKKLSYMKEVLHILGNSKDEETMPWLSNQIDALYAKTFPHAVLPYAAIKKHYNDMMCAKEADIRKQIQCKEDALAYAIQLARVGNYIDFGAMSDVNEKKLNELLENCFQITFEPKELENFRTEVLHAKKLVYITDNAGEIVLDGIFLTVLKKLNASLDICVIVRGVPVLNDATYADAQKVGLTELVRVIPNGTDVPGTPLNEVSEEALEEIEHADLCIAKGQGNFETLHGCGRNIYYLFLCKCQLFVKKFGVERFAPILSNEKRIVQYDQK